MKTPLTFSHFATRDFPFALSLSKCPHLRARGLPSTGSGRSGQQAQPERGLVSCALKVSLASTVVAALVSSAFAQDRADLDRTQIIGNRELPKVLYIVPWKKPLPGDLSGRPMASVLDEALAPIDRDVFRRQLRYDAQIQATPSAAATPPPAPK